MLPITSKKIIKESTTKITKNINKNDALFRQLLIEKAQKILSDIPQITAITWYQSSEYDNDYNRTSDIWIDGLEFVQDDSKATLTEEQNIQCSEFYDIIENSYDFLISLFDTLQIITITKDGLTLEPYMR